MNKKSQKLSPLLKMAENVPSLTRPFKAVFLLKNHFLFIANIWAGLRYVKICFQAKGLQRPRSACAFAQADQGFCCPLTEALDNIECSNGEQMP